MRGGVFGCINNNPPENRSGHRGAYHEDNGDEARFTNCARGSGQTANPTQARAIQYVRQRNLRVGDLPIRKAVDEEADDEGRAGENYFSALLEGFRRFENEKWRQWRFVTWARLSRCAGFTIARRIVATEQLPA